MSVAIDIATAPPAYAKAAAFIQQIQDNGGLSKEQVAKVQTAVTEHVKDPNTRQTIMDELKKLGETVMSIESDFATIQYHMEQIDERKIILDKAHPPQPIYHAPKWKMLHDEYTSLMNESQDTANRVMGKIDTLLNVIVPIIQGNYEMAKKQKSLDSYIKARVAFFIGLDTFATDGQKHADRFLRLKQDVDAFRKKLKQTVADQAGDVEAQIKKIDERIAKLQEELEKSSGFFTGCWDVLKLAGPNLAKSAGATIAAAGTLGTVAATAGLAAMAPVVGVGIVVAGFAALGWSLFGGYKERADQREEKQNEIIALQHEREDLSVRLQALKDLLEQLNDLDVVFDRMIDRLSAIQSIWRMLVADAQRLRDSLTSMKTTDDDLIFEVTADTVKTMYDALYLALDQYILAVPKGGIKPSKPSTN